jgi:hypothetical protein
MPGVKASGKTFAMQSADKTTHSVSSLFEADYDDEEGEDGEEADGFGLLFKAKMAKKINVEEAESPTRAINRFSI